MRFARADFEKLVFQFQFRQDRASASADEFAANAVARIMARFDYGHRNLPPTQPDAERQSGQSPANDGHRLHATILRATKRWLKSPAGPSSSCQLPRGHIEESSVPQNPARTLMAAS